MTQSSEQNGSSYQELLQRAIVGREHGGLPVAEGDGFFYRPGQLLVATDDLPRLADELRKVAARRDDSFAVTAVPVQRWLLPGDADAPELARRLRTLSDDHQPPPRVGLNHVFVGAPELHGGPGGPPRPAPAFAELGAAAHKHELPRVAVLDTGVAEALPDWHPVLAGGIISDGPDTDPLDEDGNHLLDLQAGHGGFVAGVVRQLSPGSLFDPQAVLDSYGVGDELSVATGLAQAPAPILNLSLGGYTQDDLPPVGLAGALDSLWPDRVVVAAAGNNGSDRPFWPAAFKHVIGVAALDTTAGDLRRAEFSNYGDWVDACAPGVRIRSTYVVGKLEIPPGAPVSFDKYACWSGTSFAAPQVAAAIAQRMARDGVSARVAAHRVLGDVGRPVLRELGAVVLPDVDLVCPDPHPAD